MHVGLVDGPGHHGPLMRAQLLAQGHQVTYLRAFPGFEASGTTRRRDALLHDGVRRAVAGAQRRLGLRTSFDFDVYTRLYGRLAARYVEGCDVVLGFSFVAREAHRRARRSILELPATHIATHEAIVEAEHERAGLPRLSRLSRLAVERAQAEYAQADQIEVLSSYAKKTLVDRGVAPGKIVVTPLGVDLARFRPADRPRDRFRVLCVGRIELAKGIRALAAASARLRGVELVLIGALSDEARPLLGGLEVRPPMTPDQLALEYQAADALAFPTLSDGFGLVMVEAMASGLPVVATDRSGGPDVIGDGEHGFVVPAGDAGALADRLAWLRDRPDARLEMGRAARARVEAGFSVEAYGQRLGAVLGGSAPAPRQNERSPSLR